jgi:cyclopropane-fatty-acyl-phospholipid synthase
MRLSKSHSSFYRGSRRFIALLFAAATSGHRVRLDFADGDALFIGPPSLPATVALSPPPLWRTIRIFLNPGLRAGEEFIRGGWSITAGDLTTFMRILLLPRRSKYTRLYNWIADRRGLIFLLRQRIFTEWNRRFGSTHYDAGKELYERMLDSSMQYSCAFYSLSSSDDLEEAQHIKLKTSIDRLHLGRPSLNVLDIGCGWGALAAEIAKGDGDHRVVGITLSHDQYEGAQSLRDKLLPDIRNRLEFRFEDYATYLSSRTVRFDRIISIGMLEHVGLGRHVHFFRCIRCNLTAGGRALIHSIVRPSPGAYNEWIRRNI